MSALISFFSQLISLLSQPIVGGTIVPIMILIVGLFITRKLEKKRLAWGLISVVPMVTTNSAEFPDIKDLIVQYKGKGVSNIFAHILRVQNIGNKAITLDDFRSKKLIFEFEGIILDYGEVDCSSNAVSIGKLQRVQEKIIINAFVLDKREWFTFKVITNKQLQEDKSIICTEKLYEPHTIERRDELVNKRLLSKLRNFESIFYIFLLAFSIFLFIIIVFSSLLKLNITILFYIFIVSAIIYLAIALNYIKDSIYRTLNNEARKKSGNQGQI